MCSSKRIMHASTKRKAALGLLRVALGDYSNTVVADDGDPRENHATLIPLPEGE